MAGIADNLTALTATSQSATVNTDVQSVPSVRATDIDGFPVSGVSVTFSGVTGGGAVVPTGAIVTGADGIATLTSWTLGGSVGTDNNSVTASATGLPNVVFTASGTAASAASIVADSATQQFGIVDQSVAQPPRARVLDTQGGPVQGVTVQFAITAGNGGISNSQVVTDAAGMAQLAIWVLGITAGTNTVTATVSGLSGSPVSFNATGTSAGATQMAAASATSQSAQVSTAVGAPPAVRLSDSLGNPSQGTVQFAIPTGGGSMVPSNGVVNTDSSGIAALTSWTVGSGVGTDNNSVTASAGLAGSPVTFLASGTAGPPPPPAVDIIANSTVSQSGSVGVAVTTPPSVLVRDASLVGVAGIPVQWVVTAGQGAAGAAETVTNGSGIATIPSWVLGAIPGTNTMEARAAGLTGSPVVFTATASIGSGAQFPAAPFSVEYLSVAKKWYVSGGAATVAGPPNVVRSFDSTTRAWLTDITVGSNPRGMVVAPPVGGRAEKVYVALAGGNIVVLDPMTDTVLSTITIAGAWQRGVYVAATDRVVFVAITGGTAIAIDPATDTQSTLIASSSSVGFIAHSPVAGNLYIPRTGGVLGVYTASTGALVTTVSGFAATTTGIAYVPGAVDSVWVAGAAGSVKTLDPLTTSTNVRRTAVTLGTAGTMGRILYGPETGVLYAAILQPGTPSDIVEINPVTEAEARRDPGPTNLGSESLSGWTGPQSAFWLAQTSTNRLYYWHGPSRFPGVRRQILASQVTAPQATVAIPGAPFAPGDLVSIRRNAQGSYRVRLDWPAKIAAMSDGLRREMPLIESELRGERNYALNPWLRTFNGPRSAPGWLLSTSQDHHWHGRDTNTWTTFNATLDGAHSTTTTLNLRAMTPGDVLEPGDVVAGGRWVTSRGVVSGGGTVTVQLNATISGSDGATMVVTRTAPPDWLVPGEGLVMTSGSSGLTEIVSAVVPAPFFPGLTSLWVTVEYWLKGVSAGIKHDTGFRMRTLIGGNQVGVVTPGDTTTYLPADGLVGPFRLSLLHTLTGPEAVQVALAVGGDASFGGAAYIRRIQATLGPEGDILPPFEFNASSGALFHAGQRSLRDRGAPPVSMRVAFAEDPARPARPGARADVRWPLRAIATTPRVLSVKRVVVPGAEEDDLPEVVVDNLPASLSRTLSRSGVS